MPTEKYFQKNIKINEELPIPAQKNLSSRLVNSRRYVSEQKCEKKNRSFFEKKRRWILLLELWSGGRKSSKTSRITTNDIIKIVSQSVYSLPNSSSSNYIKVNGTLLRIYKMGKRVLFFFCSYFIWKILNPFFFW